MPRKGKSLYDWCLENGDRGKIVWEGALLANDKNLENGIDIYNISKSSHVKVSFICSECNKIWSAYLSEITRNSKYTWCPNCSYLKSRNTFIKNNVINSKNNLYNWCNLHGETGEQILKEFRRCEELNADLGINEYSILVGSGQMVWFKCDNYKHEPYLMCLGDKIRRNSLCPLCSYELRGKKIRKANIKTSLYDWCESNGEQGKNLYLAISLGLSIEGKSLDFHDIGCSSRIKLPVKCSNLNHPVWYSSISTLTKGSWCPYCSKKTSFAEQVIYLWCKSNFDEVYNMDRTLGKEADILIKDIKIVIEYEGEYYHKDKKEKDDNKKKYFENLEYKVIQIYEKTNKEITQILSEGIIIHNCLKDKNCIKLIEVLCEYFESIGILIKNKNLSNEIIYKARSIMQS